MKSAFGSLLLTLALCGAGSARANAVADLRAAEQAFALLTAEQGQRAGLQRYLAEDAVLLRPQAVDAQRWLAEHLTPDGALSWPDATVVMACSGDLALSYGPWVYADSEGRVAGSGWFLTLWRRASDDGWQIVLDHSLDAPPPAPGGVAAGLAAVGDTAVASACDAGKEGSLVSAERQVNRAIARRGHAAALREAAATTLLVLREGLEPATALPEPVRRKADRQLADTAGELQSPGADLAVTHGVLRAAGAPAAAATAMYLRVWRREAGQWRIAIDAATPLTGSASP